MEANRLDTSHTTHTVPRDIACVSIDTSARSPAGLCVQPVLIPQSFPVDKSKAGKHNRPVSENNVAARQ